MQNNDLIVPNVIDIEASGFGDLSYPIEVGVVMSCGRRYCALIKRDENWRHWNADAERLHGIRQSTLDECGKEITRICDELNTLLHGGEVFSDALSHDARWLNRLYSTANRPREFNLRSIEHIMLEEQFESWDATKRNASETLIESDRRHRASVDAWLIQKTFLVTRQHALSIKKGSDDIA